MKLPLKLPAHRLSHVRVVDPEPDIREFLAWAERVLEAVRQLPGAAPSRAHEVVARGAQGDAVRALDTASVKVFVEIGVGSLEGSCCSGVRRGQTRYSGEPSGR